MYVYIPALTRQRANEWVTLAVSLCFSVSLLFGLLAFAQFYKNAPIYSAVFLFRFRVSLSLTRVHLFDRSSSASSIFNNFSVVSRVCLFNSPIFFMCIWHSPPCLSLLELIHHCVYKSLAFCGPKEGRQSNGNNSNLNKIKHLGKITSCVYLCLGQCDCVLCVLVREYVCS